MDNTASCMIEVCDLHKHYKDVHVLRGISTTVAKGEVCAVIGPSGSGKSTFLRCLNRLEEASSGEIFINAQEITDPHLNLNKMRENIGMVFQGFNLFPHMTVMRNVCDAPIAVQRRPRAEVEAQARALLAKMGLAGCEDKVPCQLSGGQCQRLVIARALLRSDSAVYIFDEAASNIDVESEELIMNVIHELAKTKTVLLISHRLANVVQSDQIYFLKNGTICERGTHAELMEQNGAYRHLYDSQMVLENYGKQGNA